MIEIKTKYFILIRLELFCKNKVLSSYPQYQIFFRINNQQITIIHFVLVQHQYNFSSHTSARTACDYIIITKTQSTNPFIAQVYCTFKKLRKFL